MTDTTTTTTTTDASTAAGDTSTGASLLGSEVTTTETTTEAKTGEQAKPGTETKTEDVKYEFKTPDGIEFDAPHLEKFTTLAKEHKLAPDVAQKFLDLAGEMETARGQQHAETVKGWLATVKGDKELGGDKLAENLAVARKTFDLLPKEQADELKGLLNQTGLEAHPVFFRLFHAVGKALSEDSFVPGGKAPSAGVKDIASRLYPSSTPAH